MADNKQTPLTFEDMNPLEAFLALGIMRGILVKYQYKEPDDEQVQEAIETIDRFLGIST